MQFEQAGDFIKNKLINNLSPDYTYHNIDHTTDVYNAAKYIGEVENISERDMKLLLTAALYHDSGFLNFNKGHEEESCRIATKALRGFGYDENQINLICGMIRATRIPQSPKTELERILADADLDYLGRDDFFQIGDNLYLELTLASAVESRNEWNKLQLHFMRSHNYFTKTAVNLRLAKKYANIIQIRTDILNQIAR